MLVHEMQVKVDQGFLNNILYLFICRYFKVLVQEMQVKVAQGFLNNIM